MTIDLKALREAAEALEDARAALEAERSWANADAVTRARERLDALLHEPATVLELLRLAAVGQQTLDRLDKQTERANFPTGNTRCGVDG